MKARVTVTLKSGVLDPQGQAISGSLRSLGFGGVASVRQGKIFDIEMGDVDPVTARANLTAMCERLLANTVIENYAIETGAPALGGVWPDRPTAAAEPAGSPEEATPAVAPADDEGPAIVAEETAPAPSSEPVRNEPAADEPPSPLPPTADAAPMSAAREDLWHYEAGEPAPAAPAPEAPDTTTPEPMRPAPESWELPNATVAKTEPAAEPSGPAPATAPDVGATEKSQAGAIGADDDERPLGSQAE